jgi:hypothetical protein
MERYLNITNGSLLVSIAGLVLTVVFAYPLADRLPMALQILAHIGTLLFAVGVKVTYIARLVFLSRLGRPVH